MCGKEVAVFVQFDCWEVSVYRGQKVTTRGGKLDLHGLRILSRMVVVRWILLVILLYL